MNVNLADLEKAAKWLTSSGFDAADNIGFDAADNESKCQDACLSGAALHSAPQKFLFSWKSILYVS